LADEVSAIYDFDPADGVYEVDYDLNPDANLSRGQTMFSRGSMSEVSFAFAGNYNDKFAFGISLGVPMANYSVEKIYTERDDSSAVGGAIPYFSDLQYREQLTTSGTGVNAKVGILVKPNQALRLSAALHTPTVLAFNDDYNYRLENNYYEDRNEQGNFLGKEGIREGTFEYTQSTPWRISLGAGLIVGKRGFLSAEVEQVDYARNKFGYEYVHV